MSTTALDTPRRHALATLAADIDALRHSLDATVEEVRWESVSAALLRRLATELTSDMRVAAYRLRALL